MPTISSVPLDQTVYILIKPDEPLVNMSSCSKSLYLIVWASPSTYQTRPQADSASIGSTGAESKLISAKSPPSVLTIGLCPDCTPITFPLKFVNFQLSAVGVAVPVTLVTEAVPS